MRICDLRNKQVINATDCRILGFVADVDFDQCTGCILAIIVPGPCRFCGFLGHEIEYVIPYKCVRCMGPDVILVDVCVEKITNKCI
jgi:YlmC/YmxH family sporulation protein